MGFAMMMGSGSSLGTDFARVRLANPWSLRFANNCTGTAIYGGGLTQTLKLIGDCSKSKKMLKPVRCQIDESSGDLARAEQDYNDATAAFRRAARKINRKRFDNPEYIPYKDRLDEETMLEELCAGMEKSRRRLEALRKEPIAVLASSELSDLTLLPTRFVGERTMDEFWVAMEIVQDATETLSLAAAKVRVLLESVRHDILECQDDLIETMYWLEGYERWERDAIGDINEAEASIQEFVQKTIEDLGNTRTGLGLELSWVQLKFAVQQLIEGSRDDIDEAGARLQESIKKTMEDRNIRSGLEKCLDELKFAVQQLIEVRASNRLTLKAAEESRALKAKSYFTAFNLLKEDPRLVQDYIAEVCAAGKYVQNATFGLYSAGEALRIVMKSVEAEQTNRASVEADGDTCEEREH